MHIHILSWLAALSLISCHSQPKARPPLPPANVTSFTVVEESIPKVYDFVGFVESSHPVEIRARVEGYLDKIAYAEGSLVQEGDLLFQLDPKQFQASVEEAKGNVAKQEALLENATLTVNRLKPLYAQKATSKKDLDNATSNLLTAQASLQSAQADLLNAEINLGYTTITSPITGMSDRSKFREGALISPGANGLLTTVSVIDPIWVNFNVSENEIVNFTREAVDKKILLPQAEFDVELILSDGNVYKHMGKVSFSSPTYNQSTGTLLVRAVFPNPEASANGNAYLLPGQFVRVKLYGATRPHSLFVPKRSLMQKKNGMFVYLINPDGTVTAQDVSTGDWFEDYQIITNGLKIGDKIVVDGTNKILPGGSVNVIGPYVPPKSPAQPAAS